jgi:Arc/MetJ-type ribon-helix-helix transcriptional regulator
MRTIMNISLPASLADEVKAEVAENGYASVSEFIRKLVRDWQEDRILKSLKQSQRDIKNGKGIYLKSLRDLR